MGVEDFKGFVDWNVSLERRGGFERILQAAEWSTGCRRHVHTGIFRSRGFGDEWLSLQPTACRRAWKHSIEAIVEVRYDPSVDLWM